MSYYRSAEANAAKESAPCEDCFWAALGAIDNDVEPDEDRAWVLARGYLYDQGAVSACPTHTHLIG